MISYDNLWNVMKEKGVSQYALIKKYNISPAQITRLKRNESQFVEKPIPFIKLQPDFVQERGKRLGKADR